MKSLRFLLLRLTVSVLAMGVLLFSVLQTINRPLGGDTLTYTAVFTDANGLKAGDDVRLYGVRVGSVTGLTLAGKDAHVTFTMQVEHPIFENSTLAIRYQNLTGLRFLDIQQPDQSADKHNSEELIGTDHTVPSFDITTLFNGLQPVLAELTPADLNQFATSLLAVVEGDGTGMGPALDAIGKLSQYTSDRQAVISTLVTNLSQISQQIGGKSGNAIELISQLSDIFVAIEQKIGGLIDFALTIPPVLEPADRLLSQLGLRSGNRSEIERGLSSAFPNPADAVAAMNRVPGLIQSLASAIPDQEHLSLVCSNGPATAPAPLSILIDGERIALCKR